ncbi:MAG TPA: hypothetical protein DCM28_18325 [Phycisphaerales bacterium]|nr:hypothetical protein [Phycisphaerales bacterium]HCD31789.1 hypothetical protein [Phycisphaerales bacterium]|tara:strand:- start:4604 stop:5686 length:1083 start_codon:yes stop_codon:yes gene_type:complete
MKPVASIPDMSRENLDRFIPKYIWLKHQLIGQMRELEAGQTLPTVVQIRKRYSVSQATVDRAVGELRVEGLVESRRGSGIHITPLAKVKRIGFVLDPAAFSSQAPPFGRELITRFQSVARERDIQFTYYINDYSHDVDEHGPTQLQKDAESGLIDGLLLYGITPPYLPAIFKLGLPVLRMTQGETHNTFSFNYTQLIQMAVKHLAQQGVRDIAIFANDLCDVGQNLMLTFDDALAEYDCRSLPQWRMSFPRSHSLELRGYRDFVERWPQWEIKPQAVISTDDNMTQGIYEAIKKLELRVPEDILFVSHANRGLTQFENPSITRIEFDVKEVTQRMIHRLEEQILNPSVEPGHFQISPRLA